METNRKRDELLWYAVTCFVAAAAGALATLGANLIEDAVKRRRDRKDKENGRD